jgi:hypothetical protein
MRKLFWLCLSLALSVGPAQAEQATVLLGKGIKVDGVEDVGGWRSCYIWLINANRTILGPRIDGRVRIAAASHAQPLDSYVRKVQLFVLIPISDKQGHDEKGVEYSLAASSPLYQGDTFCIWRKPSEIGIPLSDEAIQIHEDGTYCFSKSSLLQLGQRDGA